MRHGGSSPLARGTRARNPGRVTNPRFIPAGAGNTLARRCSSSSWSGSSPLARGTRLLQGRHRTGHRFIPAGAGNTSASWLSSTHCSVHPRWRGEHRKCGEARLVPRGSSPLARGTHRRPARHRRTRTVHPRWRGEHRNDVTDEAWYYGSSPLARGTLRAENPENTYTRFIPAGAGNTTRGANELRRSAVHPRWRGEHTFDEAIEAAKAGSSPLARGTRNFVAEKLFPRRFIPAGAGNTSAAPAG